MKLLSAKTFLKSLKAEHPSWFKTQVKNCIQEAKKIAVKKASEGQVVGDQNDLFDFEDFN